MTPNSAAVTAALSDTTKFEEKKRQTACKPGSVPAANDG